MHFKHAIQTGARQRQDVDLHLCSIIAVAYGLGEVLLLACFVWGENVEDESGLLLIRFREQSLVGFFRELLEVVGHLVLRVSEGLYPQSQLHFVLLLYESRHVHLVEFLVQAFKGSAALSCQDGFDISLASPRCGARGFVLVDGFQ